MRGRGQRPWSTWAFAWLEKATVPSGSSSRLIERGADRLPGRGKGQPPGCCPKCRTAVGALRVLLDGACRPRGIVETTRVEIMPFKAITEDMAQDYGEGERTADWCRRAMRVFYRASATRDGAAFTDDTLLIWEWFAVMRRL
jgi:hypothetical protein